MAIILSNQGRILVALCFSLLLLAIVLAVGSYTGWFKNNNSFKIIPAHLRQVLIIL